MDLIKTEEQHLHTNPKGGRCNKRLGPSPLMSEGKADREQGLPSNLFRPPQRVNNNRDVPRVPTNLRFSPAPLLFPFVNRRKLLRGSPSPEGRSENEILHSVEDKGIKSLPPIQAFHQVPELSTVIPLPLDTQRFWQVKSSGR